MAELCSMPPIEIDPRQLREWGTIWIQNGGGQLDAGRFNKDQGMNFAGFMDQAFGKALSTMLGDIPVLTPSAKSLLPASPDAVEVGTVRIVGGVRPQNFDTAYRPDGPRVVFDSKTLNEKNSIRKNWQNMINDLGTEATTVHTRFPYALCIFLVAVPEPALLVKQREDLIRTLERLSTRHSVLDQPHLAEAIAFVIWDPVTGTINQEFPAPESPLRLENVPKIIEGIYLERYKGLPPHDVTSESDDD